MIPVFSRKTLERLGVTYDVSLPQDMYLHLLDTNNQDNPFTHVVMCYPNGENDMCGLVAVTDIGAAMLNRYYATPMRPWKPVEASREEF